MVSLSIVPNLPDTTTAFLSNFKGNHLYVGINEGKTIPTKDLDWLVNKGNEVYDAYFTVNENDGSDRRKRDNITRCRAIFLDDDKGSAEPRGVWPLPPSIVVRTSATKYHYYWLTSTTDFEEWEQVEESLVTVHEGDRAVKDLARILRLPATTNHKSGFTVELLDNNGKVYKWEELVKAFPPLPAPSYADVPGSSNFSAIQCLQDFMSGEHISPSMNSLIMHYAQYGMGKSKIKDNINEMFEQLDQDVYNTHSVRYEGARVQIDKFIDSAKKNATPHTSVAPAIPEAKPIDAKDYIDYAPIPVDCLPECVNVAATEADRFLSNGKEPSILAALSITCAILAKNVKINEIGEHKTTYCSSGLVVAMSTGTRKTEVYKIMAKPFLDYELLMQEEWDKTRNQNKAMVNILKKQIGAKEKKAEKSESTTELFAMSMAIGELQDDIDKIQLAKPTLHIKDCTEARAVPKMQENGGKIAIVSDDSRNIIKNIMGRFNKEGSSEGWLIDGIAGGQDMKMDRARDGGVDIVVRDPCLNVYLMVQPDMATKLKDSEVYRDSGLAARVPIYYWPIDPLKVVENSDRTRELDISKIKPYYDILRGLCMDRSENPLIINISGAAQGRFNDFNQRYVKLLRTNWFGEYSKTNKMITQAVIYSAVMAALDDLDFGAKLRIDPNMKVEYEINAVHANMGCKYVEALYDGMVKSASSIDLVESVNIATKFAIRLLGNYKDGKIWEGFVNTSHLQNTFRQITKDNRHNVIQILVDAGWLYTTRSEVNIELNNGYPRGKCRKGDTIYHLNVASVKEQLRLQYERYSSVHSSIDLDLGMFGKNPAELLKDFTL